MLTIRSEQMNAFSKAVETSLECRLLTHVQRLFADPCRLLGEEVVRDRVRSGIRAAGGYGIEAEYDVSRYVDAMFLLEPDFDTSGRYPWAAEVLGDMSCDATTRMDRLYERIKETLDIDGSRASAGV